MSSQIATYDELAPGRRLAGDSYALGPAAVARYLRAVAEASGVFPSPDDVEQGRYHPDTPVPPTAVGAYAMKSLLGAVSLPPGSVHLSQDFQFIGEVPIGETVSCQAIVARKQERAGLRLLTFDLSVTDSKGNEVMTGRTLVTVPAAK